MDDELARWIAEHLATAPALSEAQGDLLRSVLGDRGEGDHLADEHAAAA